MHRQLLADSQTEPFPGLLPTGRHPTKCEQIDLKTYNRKSENHIRSERLKRCTQRVGHPFFPCAVTKSNDGIYTGCKSVNKRPDKAKVQPFTGTQLRTDTGVNTSSSLSPQRRQSTRTDQVNKVAKLRTRSRTVK